MPPGHDSFFSISSTIKKKAASYTTNRTNLKSQLQRFFLDSVKSGKIRQGKQSMIFFQVRNYSSYSPSAASRQRWREASGCWKGWPGRPRSRGPPRDPRVCSKTLSAPQTPSWSSWGAVRPARGARSLAASVCVTFTVCFNLIICFGRRCRDVGPASWGWLRT